MSLKYYFDSSDSESLSEESQSVGSASESLSSQVQGKSRQDPWTDTSSASACPSSTNASAVHGAPSNTASGSQLSDFVAGGNQGSGYYQVEVEDAFQLRMTDASSGRTQALHYTEIGLVHDHGRYFNSVNSAPYRLPADEEEWDRLQKQHKTFIDIMGRKYPPGMSKVMHSETPGKKLCLDLGCGSGCWIKDVARDFPHCEAVGIDLFSISDVRHLPPNVRSERFDINLGLSRYSNRCHVVHARLLSSGIRDYQLLIEDIARCLVAGGLVELQECPPWWARWMHFLNRAMRAQRGDVDAATHMRKWVSSHPAFENVVYEDCWLPVLEGNTVSHLDDPLGPAYARLRDDILVFLRAGRPLLLKSGLSEQQVDELEHNATREIYESEVTQYTRLQCVHAVRADAELEPLPSYYAR
ncbi:hypothetical protein FA15DRAFT_266869 [Coprinopsis marcescibilis]|uniref:S-adenosyl-L-methionine-dependent methyltransferase n=1 Tax=Coprinopsis marcescibilis TaxID=230819 RepID=A0A5C3L2E5_COPMA|nr:hypothetical protein FA15DRAFT_266869 [Coprinopsis marcescibilis]